MVAQVLGQLSQLRAGLEDSWAVPWAVLLALVVCTAWTATGREVAGRRVPAPRAAALATLLFAVAWVAVDKRMEGPVLWALDDQHGVSASDLASVVAAVVAGMRLFRTRTRPRPHAERGSRGSGGAAR